MNLFMNFYQKVYHKIHGKVDSITPPITLKGHGKKKALLCYIKSPFRSGTSILHSNYLESIYISEVLNELGYIVDVVDYRYKGKINYNRYELVFGFGIPYRNSFFKPKNTTKRISYMTGANPNFSNHAESARIKNFSKRNGKILNPKREVYWPWVFSTVNSNALIVVGNSWTIQTYADYNDTIHNVPVPFVCKSQLKELSNNAVKNFVWFAGPGAIHKGLDLAIEAICSVSEPVNLHVCGFLKDIQEIMGVYKNHPKLGERINIIGMVNPNSDEMDELCANNAFVLFPSCSDGTASSVITCMAKGLIPIVTKESGVNLNDFGIEIESGTVDAVKDAIEIALKLPIKEIKRQRNLVQQFVVNNHSVDAYKYHLKYALEKVI